MDATREKNSYQPPQMIYYDSSSKVRYQAIRFLGKGGFAKCYEFRNLKTNVSYAGKIVSKDTLSKSELKSKMSQEISIHRSLKHANIVQFYNYFEDRNNIYLVLELCGKRSLLEMLKRRKVITVQEVRYFMRQIVSACKYMRDEKIIHRDLKLGNLFITEDMLVKVGDFGLATVVSHDGQRKKTLCGTPNYIAPEILDKIGHSYEVDIWSIGCIMYTLLVGTPPFESNALKTTYDKIRNNLYDIPTEMDSDAKALIKKMLLPDPKQRPTPDEILSDSFFTTSYVPVKLPTSCLHMQPRNSDVHLHKQIAEPSSVTLRRPLMASNRQAMSHKKLTDTEKNGFSTWKQCDCSKDLKNIMSQLSFVTIPELYQIYSVQDEEIQDPASMPFVWISKWVDYTEKYGISYQLCDNSMGILFNDKTRMVLLADHKDLHCIAKDGKTDYYCLENYPPEFKKKVKLLNYFLNYMRGNLEKAGDKVTPRDGDELTQLPLLNFWHRTERGMIFLLTNGTLQINFTDHTKLIVCPIMGAASYIEGGNFVTYKLQLIQKYGCSKALATRLHFAKNIIQKLSSGVIIDGLMSE